MVSEMESYKTIKKIGKFECEDRKSVFIGYAVPTKTPEEAQDVLAKIKKQYPDARHHVYAYVLRENAIARFSDDREPQGTAGMPVLDVIRKKEIFDITIVVVRYFGGTLLGTGGLVHAYTQAALGALLDAEIVELDYYTYFALALSYSDYQKFLPFAGEHELRIEDTEFASDVTVTASIKSAKYEEFLSAFTDFSGGKCDILLLEEKFSL